jgi:signal transduction histidine kinase
LRGLRDRVEALGGTLDVESHAGRGTAVVARLATTFAGSSRPAAGLSSSSLSRSIEEVAS